MSIDTVNPLIAIIVLNWNAKEYTLACLASLKKLTYSKVEIIVIDNGSEDGSATTIRNQFPDICLIETGSNLGFAQGNNVGIAAAMQKGADLFFLLNNDTVVAPSILEGFLSTLETHPQAGILGAKICLWDMPHLLDHLGGMWNEKTACFDFVGLRDKEEKWHTPHELDYVCGAGFLIKRSVFEAIGNLDPRFFLIWEESDFCFRAKRAGFQIVTCPNAQLWHKVSASFVGGKPHSSYFWWRNRLLWIEKNCPWDEKIRLYCKILLPEILHIVKIHMLQKLQLILLKLFKPQFNPHKKKQKLAKNRAVLRGVWDYCLRKFGDGPEWIYRP